MSRLKRKGAPARISQAILAFDRSVQKVARIYHNSRFSSVHFDSSSRLWIEDANSKRAQVPWIVKHPVEVVAPSVLELLSMNPRTNSHRLGGIEWRTLHILQFARGNKPHGRRKLIRIDHRQLV